MHFGLVLCKVKFWEASTQCPFTKSMFLAKPLIRQKPHTESITLILKLVRTPLNNLLRGF